MVENIVIPACGVVALGAIVRVVVTSVIFSAIIICLMARIAVAWGILVSVGVAGDTFQPDMRASQRELGVIMVECRW